MIVTLPEELPAARRSSWRHRAATTCGLPLGPLVVNAVPSDEATAPALGPVLDRAPATDGDDRRCWPRCGWRAARAHRRLAEQTIAGLRARPRPADALAAPPPHRRPRPAGIATLAGRRLGPSRATAEQSASQLGRVRSPTDEMRFAGSRGDRYRGVTATTLPALPLLAALLALTPNQGTGAPHLAPSRRRPRRSSTGASTTRSGERRPAASAFTQQFPFDGAPPSEKTMLRVLYDETAIYFGFDCEQIHTPIVERLTRRDRDSESEWV